MTFGTYYKEGWATRKENLQSAIANVHSDIIGRTRPKNLEALESYYNQKFYPKSGSSAKSVQLIIDTIKQYYAAKGEELIGFEGMSSEEVLKSGSASYHKVEETIKNKKSKFDQEWRIRYSTVQKLQNTIENHLINIDNQMGKASTEAQENELKIARQKMIEYKKATEQFLELYTNKEVATSTTKNIEDRFVRLRAKEKSSLKTIDLEMFEELKAINTVMGSIGGMITANDFGIIGELGVAIFSTKGQQIAKDIGANQSIRMIEELFNLTGKALTGGSEELKMNIQRKNLELKSNSFKTNIIKNEDDEGYFFELKDSKGNSLSFNVTDEFNADSLRQQKMDIELEWGKNIKGIKKDNSYRVSMKNWSNLEGDFGKTPVIYAILRTLGKENTNRYLYSLQENTYLKRVEGYSAIVQQAHQLAKYSILVDTLMGYSQKKGYADTLFINVRSQQRVIIIPIYDIIKEVYKRLDNINVLNYKEDTVTSSAEFIRHAIDSQSYRLNQSESYKGWIMKYLQSLKTSISLAQLKPAINTVRTWGKAI